MSATVDIVCPTCGKGLKIPAELAGKKIKCKGCQGVVTVPGPVAGKPPAAKAVAAKAVAAKAVPAKPADAPIAFKPEAPPPRAGDDDDDDGNPYVVQANDGADIARCPFCANELDPPDTKVCLTCGYDMMARKRHETLKVWEPSAADYFAHLAPAVACVVVILVIAVINFFSATRMRGWLTGSILDMEENDPITAQ
ncbi:MAG: hypothetical protein ACRC7O_06680, partial [Fimbriiglobus sp.]